MPFTEDQLDNIEKKFAAFKELYPLYWGQLQEKNKIVR